MLKVNAGAPRPKFEIPCPPKPSGRFGMGEFTRKNPHTFMDDMFYTITIGF